MVKSTFGEALTAPLPPNYEPDALTMEEVPTVVGKLSNGMRVATRFMPTKTATIGVWIDTGTRFEDAKVNGVAHFLEHLIFKGTNKRDQRKLEVEVENLGAHLNAYTSREQTVYYAKALKNDIPQVTELLANILLDSKLDAGAVERERDVILREMQEVDQVPEEVLFDYLHGTAYQGSPLGRTILGPESIIRSLNQDDLRAYIAEHYKPHRMVVVCTGDIKHEEVMSIAEANFGRLAADPAGKSSLDYVCETPSYFIGSEVRVRNDDQPLAHFAMSFESCGWAHPDSPAFMVLQSLIGSFDGRHSVMKNSGNRLTAALADTPDCQSASTFSTTYTDTGLFGVYAIAKPGNLDDIVHSVLDAMIRPCFKVDSGELHRAKTALKVSMLSMLDGTTAEAEEIGRQMLAYGRRIPTVEMFARIDAVDEDAIKRIANNYFYDRELAVASIGPVHSLPDYNWMRRRTFWNSY